MPSFSGLEWNTSKELARLVERDPKAALETFRVIGYYGDSDAAHHHLDVSRTGGFGDIDKVDVMAYEDIIISLVRCVGSDYQEYAEAAGVHVDSVRLEVEGIIDLRGTCKVFGIKVPNDVKPGWKEIRVRAEIKTASPQTAAEIAHRVVWDNNMAAASLSGVPTRHEVQVKA